jgi:hypothetical protein
MQRHHSPPTGAPARGRTSSDRIWKRVARLDEVMQSFAQQVEQISVVVDSAAVGARCISDLVDLPRLKIHVAATAGQLSSLKESLARLERVNRAISNNGP